MRVATVSLLVSVGWAFFLFTEDQFPQTKDPPTTSLQLNLLLREIEILQELKFSFQRICMCFNGTVGKEI